MEKFITFDNIRNFAYVNDGVCQKPIRGIVLLVCHESEFYTGVVDEVWDVSDWSTKIV